MDEGFRDVVSDLHLCDADVGETQTLRTLRSKQKTQKSNDQLLVTLANAGNVLKVCILQKLVRVL